MVVGAVLFMPTAFSADQDSGRTASLTHIRTDFDLTVHAPYRVAFPLFGPDGERSWAGGDWNPQFVYPSPAADIPGTVFTVKHGSHQAVWVNTMFDLAEHRIQYAYFLSDVMVTTINLSFLPLDSSSTKVSVVYERTALCVEANDQVEQFAGADQARGADWEKAINVFLDKP
jgi:hypothetical protein